MGIGPSKTTRQARDYPLEWHYELNQSLEDEERAIGRWLLQVQPGRRCAYDETIVFLLASTMRYLGLAWGMTPYLAVVNKAPYVPWISCTSTEPPENLLNVDAWFEQGSRFSAVENPVDQALNLLGFRRKDHVPPTVNSTWSRPWSVPASFNLFVLTPYLPWNVWLEIDVTDLTMLSRDFSVVRKHLDGFLGRFLFSRGRTCRTLLLCARHSPIACPSMAKALSMPEVVGKIWEMTGGLNLGDCDSGDKDKHQKTRRVMDYSGALLLHSSACPAFIQSKYSPSSWLKRPIMSVLPSGLLY